MEALKIPANWGLCFAGNEAHFCAALDAALATAGEIFYYVEIGIGYGDCLRAVDQYLSQFNRPYELHGVDIVTCHPRAREQHAHPERLHLYFNGASEFFRSAVLNADFIFIDGCHGGPCVEADFLGAEKIIRPGGIVAFHDTDPGCQDIHLQPHCGTGIRARWAVEKLGLLNDTRKGWFKIDETQGNKDKGGHGCLFVKKT